MFRDAIREVRFHPSRVVATLVAIAISIGFMAAVSTFVATQRDVLGKQLSLPMSKADIVVTVNSPASTATSDAVVSAIKATSGVQAAEHVSTTTLPLTSGGASVMATAYGLPGPDFRWAGLRSGNWPTQADQIVLARDLANALKAGVGDTVTAVDTPLHVVGITNDPPSLFMQIAYLAPGATPGVQGNQANQTSQAAGTYLVHVTPGADALTVRDQLRSGLASFAGPQASYPGAPESLVVDLGADARAAAMNSLTGSFDTMRNMLLVFGAIAVLVGMIIIANTFTILLAQRRRQIGLLRAVGASTGQVQRRYLAEAVVLGAIGSLFGLLLGIGLAAIGTAVTSSLYWGLSIPWSELLIEFGVGIVITVLAAFLPVMHTSRVLPLEALRPVPTAAAAHRASLTRAIICGVLGLGGIGLVVASFNVSGSALLLAIGAGVLLTIAVLGSAQLYIPAVIRLLGAPFRRVPVGRLAVTNTLRNPGRAASTATALMLAVGLIVTLQVGTATVRRTALNEINSQMPVDLSVNMSMAFNMYTGEMQSGQPLPAEAFTTVQRLPGVSGTATLSSVPVTLTGPGISSGNGGPAAGGTGSSATPGAGQATPGTGQTSATPGTGQTSATPGGGAGRVPGRRSSQVTYQATAWTPEAHSVAKNSPASIAPDEALVVAGSGFKDGQPITLQGPSGSVTLTAKTSRYPQVFTQILVSPEVMTQLGGTPQPTSIWVGLKDRNQMASAMQPLMQLQARYAMVGLTVSGAAFMASIMEQVLNVLLIATSALLGVAVVIALVGVSNTLGLSVIERGRESALLRALGMQRRSLRLMLLMEALLLALAGVLVGILAGAFFGWLGVNSIMRQAGLTGAGHRTLFALDVWQTVGLVAIAVVAAALASVLPGRRAAMAPPTEALAEE